MDYEVVALSPAHLDKLLAEFPPSTVFAQLERAYFSPDSVALCLTVGGEPVFAGGIVNMQWRRGEAWILPTRFFRAHIKTCFKAMAQYLPRMAEMGRFVRVQGTCFRGISDTIFPHLGFTREGTMKKFGPVGEECSMWARIFEVQP